MLELFMLFLDPISPPEDPSSERGSRARPITQKQCDDGSSLVDPSGSPNWDCELDGCPALDPVCWPERLDICFDENGDDTGACDYSVQTCTTKWKCFWLWAGCEGEWNYNGSTGVGTCKVAHWNPPSPTPIPGAAREQAADPRADAGEASADPGTDPASRAPLSCRTPTELITWEVHHAGDV